MTYANYRQQYSRLSLTVLNQEMHDRTCGYWFTVSDYGTAHTAFATRSALVNWLSERGLTTAEEIPDPGSIRTIKIEGAYRTSLDGDREAFDALEGERTRVLQNGEYTLAIITHDDDGLRTVHRLNPNVRDRPVFDYQQSRLVYS